MGNYPAVERPDGWTEFFVGDLVSEESRIVCFQLGVLPLPWVDGRPVVSLERERLLEVEIAYDDVGEQEITSRTESRVMRIQATQNPEEVPQKAEVIPWVAIQRAGQVIAEVRKLMDAARLDEAVNVLSQAIASLKSYGPGGVVGEAVQQLENLQHRLASGEWSARERKRSSYRSHSYGRLSSSEHWSAGTVPPSFKKMSPPPPPPPTPLVDRNVPPTGGTTA